MYNMKLAASILIFSILWKIISASFDCPVSCECRRSVVQCVSKRISNFPTSLPNGTKQLRLQNNSITSVSMAYLP